MDGHAKSWTRHVINIGNMWTGDGCIFHGHHLWTFPKFRYRKMTSHHQRTNYTLN